MTKKNFLIFVIILISIFVISLFISKIEESNELNYLECKKINDRFCYTQILYREIKIAGLDLADYFKLYHIAEAESNWRQYDKNGKILTGKKNKYDKGIFQINILYHNLAVETAEENIKSAIELYKKYGTLPWANSKTKWSKFVSGS